MKYALICPNEAASGGYRIAQVAEEIFPVGDPTYWLACGDEVAADTWFFDLDKQAPALVPVPTFGKGLQTP